LPKKPLAKMTLLLVMATWLLKALKLNKINRLAEPLTQTLLSLYKSFSPGLNISFGKAISS